METITFIPKGGLQISDEVGEIGYPAQLYIIHFLDLTLNRIPWNWHGEMEIILVLKGYVLFHTERGQILLNQGDALLLNQNVIHSIDPASADLDCSIYIFKFHPSILFGYVNTAIGDKYLVPVQGSPNLKCIHLPASSKDSWIKNMYQTIHSIIAANEQKAYGYELATKAYLNELWLLLLQKLSPEDLSSSRQRSVSLNVARVKNAILYIGEHFSEHISLEELAGHIHVSKSVICRLFKNTLQMTPFEYLMKFRIYKAVSMIKKQEPEANSISSLALSVGFNNASYFNKIFKSYMKCTPSEYKKLLKKDPSRDLLSLEGFHLL